MAAAAIALAVVLVCTCAEARPSRRVTTDQRQHGEMNIHASLENVLILVVPATGAADLLSLAGLKRPGLLQALLKRHKYDAAADELNDLDADIAPGEPDGDEEVVATVEEMKPQTTRRPTEPRPVTEAAPEKADPSRATEVAKDEATHSPPPAEVSQEKLADAEPSRATEQTERPAPIKDQSTITETVHQSVLTVTVRDETVKPSDAAKPVEDGGKRGVGERLESPSGGTTTKSESLKSTETVTAANEELPDVSTHASVTSKDENTEKKKPEAATAKGQPWTIADFIKPVSAKEESKEEAKKALDEDKGWPVAKKGAAEARREKALRYRPAETNKWAPGLVGLLEPPDRSRFAALCAPGRWDAELRTCIMPGETRSRAELARFLNAMRFGIAIPTN